MYMVSETGTAFAWQVMMWRPHTFLRMMTWHAPIGGDMQKVVIPIPHQEDTRPMAWHFLSILCFRVVPSDTCGTMPLPFWLPRL